MNRFLGQIMVVRMDGQTPPRHRLGWDDVGRRPAELGIFADGTEVGPGFDLLFFFAANVPPTAPPITTATKIRTKTARPKTHLRLDLRSDLGGPTVSCAISSVGS
jgi:hypothetical protein